MDYSKINFKTIPSPEENNEEYSQAPIENNTKSDLHLKGLGQDQNETIYRAFLEQCTNMTNSEFFETLKMYSGYLTQEQTQNIINKYVKYDGDMQIKYHAINAAQRDKYYENFVKAKLDPTLPLESDYNRKIALDAALDKRKLNDLEKVWNTVKQSSEAQRYVVKENEVVNSKFGKVINMKTKNVIVQYKDGEVEYIGRREEAQKIQEYKDSIRQKQPLDYDIEDDPEYSTTSDQLE